MKEVLFTLYYIIFFCKDVLIVKILYKCKLFVNALYISKDLILVKQYNNKE